MRGKDKNGEISFLLSKSVRSIPGDQMIILQMSRVTMASSFNWQSNRILISDLLFCEVGSETCSNVLDTFITLIYWINQFNSRVLILIILCIKCIRFVSNICKNFTFNSSSSGYVEMGNLNNTSSLLIQLTVESNSSRFLKNFCINCKI